MAHVKGSARPTLRQRQALATQRLVVDAARALFLERGYGATTIEAIAAQAGVAASTVYAVFGSKRGILRAIREDWHLKSQVKDFHAASSREPDARRRLEGLAHATRRQWETGLVVTAIYLSAAAVDSEAAAELEAALQGRRRAIDAFVENLAAMLRPDMDVPRAAAIVRSLCLREVYVECVERSGWSPDAYEHWLAQTLKAQLLPRGR